jgi:seryl-tRNA synthetase
MATRRGPKVEPHENPRVKKSKAIVDELPEVKAEVFEEPIVNETITPELKAEIEKEGTEVFAKKLNDEIISDLREMQKPVDVLPEEKSEVDVEIENAVEEFKNLPDVPACDLTLPVEVPFIPVLETPVPPKRKTLAQLTACELNIYHKTGILPLL